MKNLDADIAIIGAGSAGLSVASGAAQLGLKVILFEKGEMGGDCLNYGCVPSKALIAAAAAGPMSWADAQARVKAAIAAIAPHDSQQRFEGLGVTVIREAARFADARTLESASMRVRAHRIVVATGSHAIVPPIPGLETTPYLTNETVFDLDRLPGRLIILGGGAIGVELGQAFRRLGAEVTIIEAARALNGFEPELAAPVLAALRADGVELLEGWRATAAASAPSGVALTIETQTGERRTLEGTHLLLAVGRRPSLNGLDLDRAGVRMEKGRPILSPTLQSTNKRVFFLGDASGRTLFTHAAGWHASAFVRTALFKARTPADAVAIPAALYTKPEIAQIGMTPAAARARYGEKAIALARAEFAGNDRAICERDTTGFAELVIGPGGKILGAAVVGAEAGELIAPMALALSARMTIRALTSPVFPYPTRSEIWKRAASAYFTPIVFSPRTRALVSVLKRF